MSTRVIFFGNEKLATGLKDTKPLIMEAVKAAGFEIEQHVTGKLSTLKPHKAQIAVLAAYGHIIPQSVLDQFPLGIINVHPSLLPKYRGSTPIEQAILDGVSKTGVSIMKLTAGMDEGPLYTYRTLHLKGLWTKQELANSLQQIGANLIKELLTKIASEKLKPRRQPHPARATYTKKISKKDGQIDWSKSAKQLEHEIRAYQNWPKSYCTLGNIEVVITKAIVSTSADLNVEEIAATKNELLVGTGNGCLSVQRIKPVGKAEMDVASFLNGYRQYFV